MGNYPKVQDASYSLDAFDEVGGCDGGASSSSRSFVAASRSALMSAIVGAGLFRCRNINKLFQRVIVCCVNSSGLDLKLLYKFIPDKEMEYPKP